MQGRQAVNSRPQAPSNLRPPTAAPAPQLQDPRLIQKFSRVSSLMSPDQLQLFVRPAVPAPPIQFPSAPPTTIPMPGNRIQTGITAPTDLFRGVTSYQPTAPAPAAPRASGAEAAHAQSIENLRNMSTGELKALGKNDKEAFFRALLPAAIESEKKHGVPAELTLAQAALESGWGSASIGGFNIFGIKGSGPAGKTSVSTKEFFDGQWVRIKDGFAKYHNFAQAVERHGKLFHNGYYDKAVEQYPKDKNVNAFIDNIQGIYATDPNYSGKIKSIIENYGLTDMVNDTGMV